MLIDEKIKLKISNNVKEYYKNLGYKIPNISNPEIEVFTKDLSKGSCVIVKCKCDVCGKINKVIYKDSKKCIDKYGYYTCKGTCTRQKNIEANIKKYGIKEPNNLTEIKEKIKKNKFK